MRAHTHSLGSSRVSTRAAGTPSASRADSCCGAGPRPQGQAVTSAGVGPEPHGDQPGHRQTPRSAAGDRHGRSDTTPAPGASFGRPASEACLALEADPSPAGRPGSFTSAQVAYRHTHDRPPVALGQSAGGYRRRETEPAHQSGGARNVSGDMELPPDQRRHPRRCPHLVLHPTVRARTLREIVGELIQTARGQPASAPAKRAPRIHPDATTAATCTPTSHSPAAAGRPRAA